MSVVSSDIFHANRVTASYVNGPAMPFTTLCPPGLSTLLTLSLPTVRFQIFRPLYALAAPDEDFPLD